MELVGNSAAIKGVKRLIDQVAKTQANVLILGESGTGKELVARIVHHSSSRHEGPFIPINCAAIPHELLESELFGHEKGSFTGASGMRQGRFELAKHGTLFLDEIGDMPLMMQAKLLRILQEKSFERVGGSTPIKTDVRIISATHKNLMECIRRNEFREDLYYRLNVFPIEIPPLRERKEDIAALINYFIHKFSEGNETIFQKNGFGQTESSKSIDALQFTRDALEFLINYEWPGNVRELANLMERLLILYVGKTVDYSDLSSHYFQPSLQNKLQPLKRDDKAHTVMTAKELPEEGFDLKEYLAHLEYAYIYHVLNEYHGVVSRAAKRLGLRRTTLVEKMKKYGIGRGIITK